MNNNQETTPRVLKSSKNRIRVEFERTSLKERMKANFVFGAFQHAGRGFLIVIHTILFLPSESFLRL